MSTPPRLRLLFVPLIILALLAGCGGAPAVEEPTAAPTPTAKPTLTPRPSATPEPTEEPTAAPKPTEEPTAAPEPTSDSSEPAQLQVDISDFKTYTHNNGVFTIDTPANWTFKDNSKPTEAIVSWVDPTGNAFLLIDMFQQDQPQSKADLAAFLKNYLDKTFGSQEDFTQEDAQESGPSMQIVWTYTGVGTGGLKAKLLANSFIKQIGNKVSLFTFVVPDKQFDRLEQDLNKILASYKINGSASLGDGGTADECSSTENNPVEIGDLQTYTHSSGVFSIDVPSNWQLRDTSKNGEIIMVWCAPNNNALVAVDIFKQSQKQSTEQLTEFLKQFLTKTFGSQPDFHMNDPKTQSDGSVLLVYSYTDKNLNNLKLLGNSFIEQHGDKESVLTMIQPNDQFDALLDKTSKIISSYKIDDSVDLP